MRFPLDMEWWYLPKDTTNPLNGRFRCAAWIKDGVLYGTDNFDQLRAVFATLPASVTFVGHNITADLTKLVEWGVQLPADFAVEDSLYMLRFLRADWPDKDLKTVCREFGYDYENLANTQDATALLEYCGKDTHVADQIAISLREKASVFESMLIDVQHRMVRSFFFMEMAGIHTDRSILILDLDEYEKRLNELIPLIPEGCATNDDMLRKWLRSRYEEKELKLLGKTESGALALNVKAMARLPRQNKEFKAIVDARAYHDYKKLYIERPLQLRNEAGFIFPKYIHMNARTQRRSTVPAIQNWPEKARHCITSRFPGGNIVSCDFRNLEARLFAYEAKCKKFLELLVEGGYPLVGEKAFGWEGVTKEDPRYKSLKIIVLAIQYNMSEGMYIRNLLIGSGIKKTYEEAHRDFSEFFDKFPEMHDERERRKQYAWKHGRVRSLVGAEIPLPMFNIEKIWAPEDWLWRRKQIENKAINYPTQCLASYVTGTALVDIQDELGGGDHGKYIQMLVDSRTEPATWSRMYGSSPGFPIIEVHDELVADVPEGRADEMADIMSRSMRKLVTLHKLIPGFDCPIDVEVTKGLVWK